MFHTFAVNMRVNRKMPRRHEFYELQTKTHMCWEFNFSLSWRVSSIFTSLLLPPFSIMRQFSIHRRHCVRLSSSAQRLKRKFSISMNFWENFESCYENSGKFYKTKSTHSRRWRAGMSTWNHLLSFSDPHKINWRSKISRQVQKKVFPSNLRSLIGSLLYAIGKSLLDFPSQNSNQTWHIPAPYDGLIHFGWNFSKIFHILRSLCFEDG